MKYYRLISVSFLVCFLSIFSWQFSRSEPGREELFTVSVDQDMDQIDERFQEPFNLVYHFYQAMEKNDWVKVKTFVTTIWWAEMHRSGYKQKWQRMIQEDPSIDFVMFLVAGQNIDEEKSFAWVKGRVDWASSRQKMDDKNETVFFTKENGQWKINSIRVNMPVEVVEEFYQRITEGNFGRISSYLTKKLWRKLDRGEVIDSLADDWQKNRTGVYCVFFLEDFGTSRNSAWVTGDVLWNPLTARVKETPVTIFLTNVNDGWKIDKINGHWDGEK